MAGGNNIRYPSIEKPWLRYYHEDALDYSPSKENLYTHIRRGNHNHGNDIAISFYDKNISFADFFAEVEDAAKVLSAIGIKSGDVVSFIAVTTPEVLTAIYALNKIGAVCNMLDPRMSDDTIHMLVEQVHSKYIILLNMFSGKISSIRGNEKITVVVIDSDSGTKDSKYVKTLSWKNLIDIYADMDEVPSFPYVENWPALIEYTGGTTGEPKGVLLSNDNINSVSDQYSRNGIPLRRGDTWQCVAAPFIAYVMILSTHVPLSHGITVGISVYDPKLIVSDIIKNDYNHIAANPAVWEMIISSPDTEHKDFSRLLMPISGADAMSIQLQKRINQFLSERGCKNVVCNGYGMTESGIAGCVNLSKSVSKYGSVGVPFVKTCISAFRENTCEELPYNTTGEICINGPSVMIGYVNNHEATESVLKTHADGKVWLHTGDFGYIDEDGFVFIEGRIKRMLIKNNGAKVFPSIIEAVLLKNTAVYKCAVVGGPDKENVTGQVPVAFVVLDRASLKNKNDVERELLSQCQHDLPEYACPEHFYFVENLPLTTIGKIDFRVLENIATQNERG